MLAYNRIFRVLPAFFVAAVVIMHPALAASAESGVKLMKHADTLKSQGKLEEAGEEYSKAAEAFGSDKDYDKQSAAYQKSAECYEKVAADLQKSIDAKQKPGGKDVEPGVANEATTGSKSSADSSRPAKGDHGTSDHGTSDTARGSSRRSGTRR